MAQRRSFKMRIKGSIFEFTIKPLFNIFGWTLAFVKAKRIEEG